MSNTSSEFASFANKVSPEEFELFLRRYLSRQVRRLPPNKTQSIFLKANILYNDDPGELRHVSWIIMSLTDVRTEGEILSDVIDEHERRMDFQKTCTLRLIES